MFIAGLITACWSNGVTRQDPSDCMASEASEDPEAKSIRMHSSQASSKAKELNADALLRLVLVDPRKDLNEITYLYTDDAPDYRPVIEVRWSEDGFSRSSNSTLTPSSVPEALIIENLAMGPGKARNLLNERFPGVQIRIMTLIQVDCRLFWDIQALHGEAPVQQVRARVSSVDGSIEFPHGTPGPLPTLFPR